MDATSVEIPNRSLFRQPEVCEIAKVQPYVLRSWEAEFPDLGVSKTEGGPRVYRRADVERVLHLKHLLFVEGLTLAGARKKLLEDQPSSGADAVPLDDLLGSDARERILHVKRGLREIAAMLGGESTFAASTFARRAPADKSPVRRDEPFALQQPVAKKKAAAVAAKKKR